MEAWDIQKPFCGDVGLATAGRRIKTHLGQSSFYGISFFFFLRFFFHFIKKQRMAFLFLEDFFFNEPL